MPQTRETTRNWNLDLIRVTAVLSVVGVHFFLHNGFYDRYVQGGLMQLSVFLRTLCMVCVPLFLLLSGYLCGHRRPGWPHMVKLIPVLLTVLLCAVPTLAFRVLVAKEALSLGNIVIQLLNGDAIPYGWYIKMYVGLYLLIPFLNAAYQGLRTKREKQYLLLSMAALTILPGLLNNRSLLLGFRSDSMFYLTSEWWIGIWPLTYYFLGAYIREYDPKIPTGKNLAYLLLSLLASTAYNCWRSGGDIFFQPFGNNWGGLQNTVNAVLLFLLLLHLDLSWLPRWIQGLTSRLSRISLGLYLCSWMSDYLVYYRLVGVRWNPLYMPLLVGLSFLLAALMSQTITWIQDGIWKLAARCRRGNTIYRKTP